MSQGALRRRVETGAFVRVARGVYAASAAPNDWEQLAFAACLAAGPAAMLSHRSAAAAWALDSSPISLVEITVPAGHSGRPPMAGVRLYRARALASSDRARLGALPVTSVPRTLADLAGVLDEATLAAVVEDALARRLVTPAQLSQALERRAARRGKGAGALRSVLAPWLAGDRLESAAEGEFRRAIVAAGLPAPRTQFRVRAHDREYRLDFAWPDRLVALEVDGYRWHSSPSAHAADSHRANALAELGWQLLRATPRELECSPDAILGALRRRLAG